MQKTPLVAMTDEERICFDRGMIQWRNSLCRQDMNEEDRVKGALLTYQRQAFAFQIRKEIVNDARSD